MYVAVFMLTTLAGVSHGSRLQTMRSRSLKEKAHLDKLVDREPGMDPPLRRIELSQSERHLADPSKALAVLLVASNPTAAFNVQPAFHSIWNFLGCSSGKSVTSGNPGRLRSSSIQMAQEQGFSTGAAVGAKKPWGCFEKIWCMNLDRRPERWEFMVEQFLNLRMPVQRLSAVDGQTIDAYKLAEKGIIAPSALLRYYLPAEQKLFGTDLTDGGIGCALSHMVIWKDIINMVANGKVPPDSMFLVIEDDCQFVDGFNEELLLQRLSHVPPDWELIYLGGQDLLHKQEQYTVAEGVRRLYKGFRETTAYVINCAGAKACLEVSIPMFWQIDTHLNDMSLREGLRQREEGDTEFTMYPRGYCLFPPVVGQERDAFNTDVQKGEH